MSEKLEEKLQEFAFLWTTEKDDWTVKNLIRHGEVIGQLIINEKAELICKITDMELHPLVVDRMIKSGSQVIERQID